ncbi:TIGR01459 family HAD-type hydrolase [Pelagibius sp. Alg239-R121]|uniref:TIGR01459 family HAD-type hydrolase n=1 Tax=Pelagibius sp. Alg239-R121 TaxID=2993448 RepID=UPI0024A7715E|nr:TIGR01459 family HAD-type hydrolase [Pelagibius sp. Alg239-R121]
MISIHDGLSALSDNYDGYIIDLWGVMHDGVQAFPEAVDCVSRLKDAGKQIAILSNAPRRAEVVIARNQDLGIAPDLADVVMSSGEDAWQHLSERPDDWYRKLGRRCYHLGPERDLGMREGLDYDFVAQLAGADFILNTGTLSFDHKVEDYDDLLAEAVALQLPMVCANPDLVVIRGGVMEFCAGSVAARYEELGGDLRSHGKPHRGVYERCFEMMGATDRSRIAGIGDSLRTDIAGAKAVGIAGIFVADGIHRKELDVDSAGMPAPDKLEAVFAAAPARPTAVLPRLRW